MSDRKSVSPRSELSETQVGKELQGSPLPPELRTYFLQQLTEEEVAAALLDLRELRETGGLELSEFIQGLEQVVHSSEPTGR